MVGHFAGEATDGVDDHVVDLVLVDTAELQEAREFRAICCLSRFAFLHKNLLHCDSITLAVFSAEASLCREAEVVDLLFRRNSAIDDGTHSLTLFSARPQVQFAVGDGTHLVVRGLARGTRLESTQYLSGPDQL